MKLDSKAYLLLIACECRTNTGIQIIVSQPVGRGSLVGLGDLCVGRQTFLVLFKTIIIHDHLKISKKPTLLALKIINKSLV